MPEAHSENGRASRGGAPREGDEALTEPREKAERQPLWEATEENLAVQRAARRAVLNVPLFPDLERRLIAAFGPTAEAIMLHQLCYWFSKDKMRERWSLYLTYADWREQRGLNRKQVDKGRARLKPTGIFGEKHGNYKRLHYTLDWVRLAERLAVPLKGGQSPSDTPKGGAVEPATPKGGAVRSATPYETIPETDIPHKNGMNDPPEEGGRGVHSNAGDYAEEYARDYPSEDSPLQGGGDGSSSRTPPPPFEENSALSASKERDVLPSDPEIRWDAAPAVSVAQKPPRFDPETDHEYRDVLGLLKDPSSAIGGLARRRLAGEVGMEQLLEAVSYAQWGAPRFAESYRERVAQALDEVREDLERERVLA